MVEAVGVINWEEEGIDSSKGLDMLLLDEGDGSL